VIGTRLAPADDEDVMTPWVTPTRCHSERSEESRSELVRIGARGEIPRYARNDTTLRRRRDASIPGPLRETLELVLGNQIYIPKEALSPALRNRLIRMAAFQNPEFYRVAMGLRPTHRNESHKRGLAQSASSAFL